MAAPVDGIQDPYLATPDLPTYEHLKIYNKVTVGIPESDSYDITRSNWTDPETSINQGQEDMTKFYSMFAEIFKESDRVHACPAVSTTHQR